MRPIQHKSNNAVLAPPADVPNSECVALPITRVAYDDKTLAIRSYWMPTKEELEALNHGEPVCFEIFQITHAPILLGVDGVTMSTTFPMESKNDPRR